MQQGVTFNMEGPMMSGHWYNPKTGDSFTVKDSFFENNKFMVMTTDGRILEYNQIQHYVQSDKPITKESNKSQSQQDIPMEVLNMLESNNDSGLEEPLLLPEDANLFNNNPYKNVPYETSKIVPEDNFASNPKSDNYYIIDRALSKVDLPEMDLKLKWKQSPDKEVSLLMDVMNIDLDEIVEWYMNKFDMNEIRQRVQHEIKILLYNKYGRPESSNDAPIQEKSTKTKEKKIKNKS